MKNIWNLWYSWGGKAAHNLWGMENKVFEDYRIKKNVEKHINSVQLKADSSNKGIKSRLQKAIHSNGAYS